MARSLRRSVPIFSGILTCRRSPATRPRCGGAPPRQGGSEGSLFRPAVHSVARTACRSLRQAVFSLPLNNKSVFSSGGSCVMLFVSSKSAAFKRRDLPHMPWSLRRCTVLYSRAVLETGRLSVFEEKARRRMGIVRPSPRRVLRMQSTSFCCEGGVLWGSPCSRLRPIPGRERRPAWKSCSLCRQVWRWTALWSGKGRRPLRV